MPKAAQTRPFDVVVALRLLQPAGTLSVIADELAVAPSQVHAALGRLDLAGLISRESRVTNARALQEFLLGGVRYAFPAQRGPLRDGVPTAYSAAPLNAVFDALDALVWPSPSATRAVRGFSMVPLYPHAPKLLETSPSTYRLLAIVDALRLGDPRVRPHARAALEAALSGAEAASSPAAAAQVPRGGNSP